jgi:hypothetical protein
VRFKLWLCAGSVVLEERVHPNVEMVTCWFRRSLGSMEEYRSSHSYCLNEFIASQLKHSVSCCSPTADAPGMLPNTPTYSA